MLSIVLLCGMLFLSHTVMVIGVNINPHENRRKFFVKKIVDIVVVLVHFFTFVAFYNLLIDDTVILTKKTIAFMTIVNVVSCCFNFYTFASQIPWFKKNIRYMHGKEDKAMVIGIVVGLFFSIVEIYFSLFMVNSDWFVIDESIKNNALKTAFEFIYYTFSVTITYSGSGIEAIGTLPKILQMMHVLFFYIFAGDAILQLIKKE